MDGEEGIKSFSKFNVLLYMCSYVLNIETSFPYFIPFILISLTVPSSIFAIAFFAHVVIKIAVDALNL
jgi:hypothetical protein